MHPALWSAWVDSGKRRLRNPEWGVLLMQSALQIRSRTYSNVVDSIFLPLTILAHIANTNRANFPKIKGSTRRASETWPLRILLVLRRQSPGYSPPPAVGA